MNEGLRRRFWVETGMALVSSALVLLTIVWKDWIELVLKVDPDAHGGSVEWLIVAVAVAITLTSLALARLEWSRRAAVSV